MLMRGMRRVQIVVVVLAVITAVTVHAQTIPNTRTSVPIVAVVNYVAVNGGEGDFQRSRLLCAQNGGFLPAEISNDHHEQVIRAAQGVTSGTQWFAYLGGSSDINNTARCPVDKRVAGSQGTESFPQRSCLYRWNQGRWLALKEPFTDALIGLDFPNAGVSFYKGNYYKVLEPENPVLNGFPSYFVRDASNILTLRPNLLLGQYLVAAGQGTTSVWSDNVASGGYAYQNWKGGTTADPFSTLFDEDAMQSTRSMFVTVCQVQTFDRTTYEQFNTTSALQERWWIIFLVIFFVVCFVGFIIVVACQEREDIDEPPEDAPDWAEEQSENVKRSTSFVSSRNLRTHNDTTNELDNHRDASASRHGSMYSSHSHMQEQDSAYLNPLQTSNAMEQETTTMQDNWVR